MRYLYYNNTGNITKIITTINEEEANNQIDEESVGYITNFFLQDNTSLRDYIVVNNELVLKDEITRINSGYIQEKLIMIDNYRNLLEYSVIQYDGKNIDTDQKSRENIQGKILELESKLSLNIPIDNTQLFWKTADNNVHFFNNTNEYLEWLKLLAIAIAERTTQLYNKAWNKKEYIKTITSLSELLEYDIQLDW